MKLLTDGFTSPNKDKAFNEYVGPKRSAQSASMALEFFQLFMTNDILDQIVTETNRFYHQKDSVKPSPMKWHDISKEELLEVFAIMIAMGIANLPANV